MYRMTQHAEWRMHERRIDPLDVIDALSERYQAHESGRHIYRLRSKRVGVVVDPKSKTIVTVYRYQRRDQKRGGHR